LVVSEFFTDLSFDRDAESLTHWNLTLIVDGMISAWAGCIFWDVGLPGGLVAI